MSSIPVEKLTAEQESAMAQRKAEILNYIEEHELERLLNSDINKDQPSTKQTQLWLETGLNSLTAPQFLNHLLLLAMGESKEDGSYFAGTLVEMNNRAGWQGRLKFIDPNNASLMILAISTQDSDLVKNLVKAGFDPNASLPEERSSEFPDRANTYIHRAFDISWNINLVDVFLDEGSDPNQKDLNGQTLRERATLKKDFRIIELLDKHEARHKRKNEFFEFLGEDNAKKLLAMRNGYEDKFNRWLKRDDDPAIKNLLNEMLDFAVDYSFFKSFDFLLELHQKTGFIDTDNAKVLEFALSKGDYVKPLIDCGFDVNGICPDSEETHLFSAYRRRSPISVGILLLAGANREEKNKDGLSLIEFATQDGNEEILNLLQCTDVELKLKVFTLIVDQERVAKLQAYHPQNEQLIKKWTHSKSSDVSELLYNLLFNAVKQGDFIALQLLLEVNKNFHFVRRSHVELICEAIKTKNLFTIFQMLELRINVNHPTKISPLSFAIKTKDPSILEMIIDAGADLDPSSTKLKLIAAGSAEREKKAKETKRIRLQEILDYTTENSFQPLKKEELESDLANLSVCNKHAIKFWLLGKVKYSVEEFLKSLFSHAAITGDIRTHNAISIMLLKIPKEKDRQELQKDLEERGERLDEYFKVINREEIDSLLGGFPPYFHLYASWLFGLDYKKIRSGSPDYTEVNLLNDLLEMCVKRGDETLFEFLIKVHERKNFIDAENKKLLTLARKSTKTGMEQKLLDLGFVADESVEEGSQDSHVESSSEKTQEKQEDADTPLLDDILSALSAQILKKLNKDNGRKEIARHWKAFPPCPTVEKNDVHSFLKFMSATKDFESKLAIDQLPKEISDALENIVIYGAKLWKDSARPEYEAGKKHVELWAKIGSLSQFMKVIFSQENLTKDSIAEAYTAFQVDDLNRGTNFFKVHSFFSAKRYKDKDGAKHLIKSTTGELIYELRCAVKNNQADVVEEEELERSEVLSQS